MSDQWKRDVDAIMEGFVTSVVWGFSFVVFLFLAFVGFVLVAEAWRWLAGIFGM